MNSDLSALPSVDRLLNTDTLRRAQQTHGRERVTAAVRAHLDSLRTGAQDGGVLEPGLAGELHVEAAKQRSGAIAQHVHQVGQDPIMSGPRQGGVKFPVQRGDLAEAPGLDRVGAAPQDVLDLGQDRRVPPARGEACVGGFQGRPHLQQLVGFVGRQDGDHRAATRRHLDQALRGEGADRLADRVAGNSELVGQAVFDQSLAWAEAAGKDGGADRLGHLVAQRGVGVAERAAGDLRRGGRHGGRSPRRFAAGAAIAHKIQSTRFQAIPSRNCVSSRLTSAGCSCWTQCPAPSSKSQLSMCVQAAPRIRSKAPCV